MPSVVPFPDHNQVIGVWKDSRLFGASCDQITLQSAWWGEQFLSPFHSAQLLTSPFFLSICVWLCVMCCCGAIQSRWFGWYSVVDYSFAKPTFSLTSFYSCRMYRSDWTSMRDVTRCCLQGETSNDMVCCTRKIPNDYVLRRQGYFKQASNWRSVGLRNNLVM